jgi:signal peptidase II
VGVIFIEHDYRNEAVMTEKLSSSGWRWLWITAAVLLLDRFSKTWILQSFSLYETLRVNSFFNLTLAYNKGAAFSFLNSASGWQSWIFGAIAIIISCVLLVWLRRVNYRQWWLSVALNLIIGGALGNLVDRISYNHVIDFLQLHAGPLYWPVFNVADSCICVGAAMLVLDSFRKSVKS